MWTESIPTGPLTQLRQLTAFLVGPRAPAGYFLGPGGGQNSFSGGEPGRPDGRHSGLVSP